MRAAPHPQLAGLDPQWQHARMMRPRRAREEGHKRKFLVVVDDTPECLRALSYAARRAAHSTGAVVLLFVIEP